MTGVYGVYADGANDYAPSYVTDYNKVISLLDRMGDLSGNTIYGGTDKGEAQQAVMAFSGNTDVNPSKNVTVFQVTTASGKVYSMETTACPTTLCQYGSTYGFVDDSTGELYNYINKKDIKSMTASTGGYMSPGLQSYGGKLSGVYNTPGTSYNGLSWIIIGGDVAITQAGQEISANNGATHTHVHSTEGILFNVSH